MAGIKRDGAAGCVGLGDGLILACVGDGTSVVDGNDHVVGIGIVDAVGDGQCNSVCAEGKDMIQCWSSSNFYAFDGPLVTDNVVIIVRRVGRGGVHRVGAIQCHIVAIG